MQDRREMVRRRGQVGRVFLLTLAAVGAAACQPGDGQGSGKLDAATAAGTEPISRERPMMGTFFRVQVAGDARAETAEAAIEAAFEEVARIEDRLSEWREGSDISAVNREAGRRSVTVGPELFEVVERSLEMRERTGGAFDITFAGCGRLWAFRPPRVPDAEEIARCLPRVGGEVVLDAGRSTVFLPHAEARIGIAGIGKGYGVDRAAEVLEAHGITDYIVDGGGDIRLAGRKGDLPWSVGIAHPRRPGQLYAAVELGQGAVVTSGDYQKFFQQDGVRYHHILDPRTGRPARLAAAVTVVAPDATRADALATGLFVMGPEAGLALVETLPGVEALFFGPDLEVHRSSGFPELH
jgi:thiamine biosynthesis lipoprotein